MASIEANSLSPSVMSWFGQELETRGIDAVIYTRYILSILQQEDDPCSDVTEHWEAQFFPPCKNNANSNANAYGGAASVHANSSTPPTSTTSCPATGNNRSRSSGKGRKSEKRKTVSSEELKKSAAIECLLSVSDEVSNVRKLARLKKISCL